MTKSDNKFKFPEAVLKPVKNFLIEELGRLKKRRVQIEKDDPFADESRTSDNAAPDFEADEQFGHARSEAIGREISKKIIQIRKALSRVKIGRYGICEKCGEFIDTKRLMVYPETTICVNCTEKQKKEN
ncbi:MAG: TraR/DksA C4-type zinc finger protein [Patescibacteria group bacterium]|nr:TraR/DksA C4-type zinc finger protein [Patescibacteria group bacterium]